MSINNNILNILNLKEKNLYFPKKFITYELIDGVKCQIYHADLKFKPHHCKHCGVIYENFNMIVHCYDTSNILLPKISGMKSYLRLRKQRYFCKSCNKTFVLSSNIVNENCFISNNVKYQIALDATKKCSETDIAKDNLVSNSTVVRVIDSSYTPPKPVYNYLPENIGFDEFKSVKSANGNMSFIFCDLDKNKTIDIVENRQLFYLLKYFARFSHKARSNVKRIVVDIYIPYIVLIKKMFPNATIIIDKFHIIQHMNRALNKSRIDVMKKINKHSKKYRLLKKYWKKFLKNSEYIDKSTYKRWSRNDNLKTEYQMIHELLDLNPSFKETYKVYQSLLFSIKNKNINLFNSIISSDFKSVSNHMKTVLITLRNIKQYIINSFNCSYTNAFVEGFNNKIKVIKRIAFGYRSFLRFKKRILIIANLITSKKTLNYSI